MPSIAKLNQAVFTVLNVTSQKFQTKSNKIKYKAHRIDTKPTENTHMQMDKQLMSAVNGTVLTHLGCDF